MSRHEHQTSISGDALLGKQRVETLQILRALELPDYGWTAHPAVRMWRGRTPALVVYGRAMVREWRARGFADGTDGPIAEFAPDVADAAQSDLAGSGLLPAWLGDEALHRSHRSNLLAKDPAFYRVVFTERFGTEPEDLPYVWPESDELSPPPQPEGVRLWVVHPRAHGELGVCLAAGLIGLGTQSGVDVDASGLGPFELRALARASCGRRPAKDLRQLSAFLDDVRPGESVALLVQSGAGLLLGEVTGGYRFESRELLPHRRSVRWDRVVPRSAVRSPATLQDPRALFSVIVDAEVLH
jgi:hypothetical protein